MPRAGFLMTQLLRAPALHEVPSHATVSLLATLECYIHQTARAEIDCKHPGTKTDPVVNQETLHTEKCRVIE